MAPIRAIANWAVLIATFMGAAMAADYDDFAAFNDDAPLLQLDHRDPSRLGPRYFMNGKPPVPALLSNNEKRQNEAIQCENGKHSCLELGPVGARQCCDNDQYCFLNDHWQPQCCPLGNCGSPCPSTLLYCNSTATTTTTIATTGTITALVLTSLEHACCNRPCSTSSFLCQEEFGGQCCPNGARCVSGNGCFFPTATSAPTLGTAGCTTSCNAGSTCTEAVSATTTSYLCAVNLTVVENSPGLSEGARAGIGVGVGVVAAIIIFGITWFWIHRRRVERSRRGGDTLAGSARDDQDFMGPYVPAMSDTTSPTGGIGPRPPLHDSGLAYTYLGPNAVEGPYTDRGTPGQITEPSASPGLSERGAMPATHYPENPNDILRPVELFAPAGVRAELGDKEEAGAERMAFTSVTPAAETEDETSGPFELYGSPGSSPPPLSPDEAERLRLQGVSVSPLPGETPGEERDEAHK
ncbi:hypothetical protein GGR54DRAFT_513497 [Hypoxylon sp. NC1633]|nr:hypothetical protein GGR54DRAFT_513497 [Hypoxylon sp. NC1633]